ncbi:TonB-dependent receptor [Candidatus Litorirhabdus singularis]|nr:TonB-dependent receptor [Candidatus Litorirhabdus singularis]
MSFIKSVSSPLAGCLTLVSSLALSEASTNLEHVIVSGTRSEQASVAIPASIQVLTSEQIRLSGAPNLVQVLNAQAGIQIKDSIGNQGRGATIAMRGFGSNSSNNVLVMVDGRKLNNPSLAGPDLASIALKDIDRIEITQGSAGTLYGDQATGGVINVITRKSKDLAAHLEAAAGTDGYVSYEGAVSQTYDSGLSFRLSGEQTEADNFRDNNQSEYTNILANGAYENTRFSVFLEAQQIADDLRLPGSLSSGQIRDDRKQTFTPDDFSDRDTDVYRLGGSVNLFANWALLGEYNHREEDSKGWLGSSFTGKTQVETFDPRVTGEIDTANGPILITAGIDLEDSGYDSQTAFGGTDVSQEMQDVYVQIITPLTESLKLTLGARNSDFEAKNNIDADKFTGDITVYQIGLAWQVDNRSRLFLRRDESFRWANADENGFVIPTVDFLDAQESTSWELGGETRFNDVFLSAVFYYLKTDNEIAYDPSADGPFGPGTGANINLDESERTGVVLTSIWQATESLTVQLNYSYVDAEISSGTFEGNTLPEAAKSTANLVVSYQFDESWSFYTDAQYTGKLYASGDEANQGNEISDYTVLNANVRWDYQKFYANLRASNITGKKYNGFNGGVPPYDYNYPAPEETFQFTVGYNF